MPIFTVTIRELGMVIDAVPPGDLEIATPPGAVLIAEGATDDSTTRYLVHQLDHQGNLVCIDLKHGIVLIEPEATLRNQCTMLIAHEPYPFKTLDQALYAARLGQLLLSPPAE